VASAFGLGTDTGRSAVILARSPRVLACHASPTARVKLAEGDQPLAWAVCRRSWTAFPVDVRRADLIRRNSFSHASILPSEQPIVCRSTDLADQEW